MMYTIQYSQSFMPPNHAVATIKGDELHTPILFWPAYSIELVRYSISDTLFSFKFWAELLFRVQIYRDVTYSTDSCSI